MRSRSSISSSRFWRSWFLWTLVAVIGIELTLSRTLPSRFWRHEVDRLLHDVDTRQYDARRLSLGNSVARQLDRAIARLEPGYLEPLASNAAIETAGQYFLLRRYLERNPPPEAVILCLQDPFQGTLNQVYTENYVQRCFLRWREIAAIGLWKADPVFTAGMVAYKLLPSLRCRLEIQALVPFLAQDSVALAGVQEMTGGQSGFRKRISSWWQRQLYGDASFSAITFGRLLDLCEARGIRVYFIPTPVSESNHERQLKSGQRDELNRRLTELAARHPHFRFLKEPAVYPEKDFSDGEHFQQQCIDAAAAEHLERIRQLIHDDTDGI